MSNCGGPKEDQRICIICGQKNDREEGLTCTTCMILSFIGLMNYDQLVEKIEMEKLQNA